MTNKLPPFWRLEKEILDRYLDVVLKGNKDGLKVILFNSPVMDYTIDIIIFVQLHFQFVPFFC